MIRRLIILICLVLTSFLLAASAVSVWKEMVLWNTSRPISDGWTPGMQIGIVRGCLRIEWESNRYYSLNERFDFDGYETDGLLFYRESRPETIIGLGDSLDISSSESMVVRLWMLAILLAVYPGVCFIRGPYRRRHRRRKGLCIHCGYNLTGNVSGICPECGRKVDGQAVPKR